MDACCSYDDWLEQGKTAFVDLKDGTMACGYITDIDRDNIHLVSGYAGITEDTLILHREKDAIEADRSDCYIRKEDCIAAIKTRDFASAIGELSEETPQISM